MMMIQETTLVVVWNSLVMVGTAMLTMLASSEDMNVARAMETNMNTCTLLHFPALADKCHTLAGYILVKY